MEELRGLGLLGLHKRLMEAARSKLDDLPPMSVQLEIDALGWLTQELLVSTPEANGSSVECSPLAAAYCSGNLRVVEALLKWNVVPSLADFAAILRCSAAPRRGEFVGELLRRARPAFLQTVLWLSCQYNEASVTAVCLDLGACPDTPPVGPAPDSRSGEDVLVDIWQQQQQQQSRLPAPILYAASRGHLNVVEVLHRYGAHMEVTDDEDISCLLWAAFGAHRSTVEYLMSNTELKLMDRVHAYEVLGAANIIRNSSAVGKVFWRKAIKILEDAGGHKSRRATNIGMLENVVEFRTADELNGMRAKELRVQALIVMEKHFARTRLFVDALLAKSYTVNISIYTMYTMLYTDRLTVDNIRRIEEQLAHLGVFKVADVGTVVPCLEWCVAAVGHLRSLLDILPVNRQDLVRFSAVVDLICRLLLCLEYASAGELDDGRLQHVLRRVVGVCQPLASVRSLLHALMRARHANPGPTDIFTTLARAAADMEVVDSEGNTLLHEAVGLLTADSPATGRRLLRELVEAGVNMDACNRNGVSVKDTVQHLLSKENES